MPIRDPLGKPRCVPQWQSRGGGASSRREKPNGHSGRKSLSAPTPPSPRRLRHEDFLRSVRSETRHPRVLRRRRRDVRLLRLKVRVVVEKEKEDGRRLRSNSPRAPGNRRRRRRDDARRRLPGGAIESSPTANRSGGPLAVADLAPLPPVSYLPRSIHSANPVVAKHERVAFKANSTKPCATSARCVRAITARNVSSRVSSRDDARVRDRFPPSRGAAGRVRRRHMSARVDFFSPRRGPTAPRTDGRLLSPCALPRSSPPISQVNPVYVVCHEDRAFLCRECDVSIHSANEHVMANRRFLMSGCSLSSGEWDRRLLRRPRPRRR